MPKFKGELWKKPSNKNEVKSKRKLGKLLDKKASQDTTQQQFYDVGTSSLSIDISSEDINKKSPQKHMKSLGTSIKGNEGLSNPNNDDSVDRAKADLGYVGDNCEKSSQSSGVSRFNLIDEQFEEVNEDVDTQQLVGIFPYTLNSPSLAQKYDLQKDNNVTFGSDVQEAQIIEVESTEVKTTEQPEVHKKENEQYVPNRINSDACPKAILTLDILENSIDKSEENWDTYDCQPSFNDDSLNLTEKYQMHPNKNSTTCDDFEMTQQEEEALLKRSQVFIVNAESIEIDDHPLKSLNEIVLSQSDNMKQSMFDKITCNNAKGECTILTASIIDEVIKETKHDLEECENKPEQIDKDDSNNAIIFPKDFGVMSPKILRNELSNSSQLKHDTNVLKCNGHFFCNAINDYEVLVLLREPFHIYGTVRLTVLLGSIQIYGYIPIVNEEVEIFSLRGCNTIGIYVIHKTYNNSKNENDHQKSQELKNTLEEIFEKYRSRYVEEHLKILLNSFQPETDAIILLSRNMERKRLQQQFHKCMDQNVFPNMKTLNVERPLYDTECRLRCIINTSVTETKSLKIPMQWQNFTLNDKSKVLVAGGKAVGKSTLLKYLINKHLSKHKSILYIDLDIGQPEIFVPQTISCCLLKQPLIGPGFMLNLEPDKSYAVGHTNIIMCPHRYVRAVQELITFCNDQLIYQNIPWLINTMGYNKGFGLELLSVITDDLKLTDLIQIQSDKEINNYDCLLYSSTLSNVTRKIFPNPFRNNDKGEGDGDESKVNKRSGYSLHVWKSVVNDESSRYNKEWDMSAKDLRYANLLSRLSSSLTDTLEWLTDSKPLKTNLGALKFINLQETVNCEGQQLLNAFEANLIYLCQYKSAVTLECLGLGVIRAINYDLNEVYLVPAAPLKNLIHVDCLLIGEMPLPTTMFIIQGLQLLNTAPFAYNTIDAKTSKAIKHFCRRYDNDMASDDNENSTA